MMILRAAAVVLLTFVTYLPAQRAGFVWDDLYLTASPVIKAGDGLYRIWCTFEPRDYFPVSYSLFWLEWRAWGTNAAGYHFVNILLHALGAVLLWLVLGRMRVAGAWLGALLFAVHPLNVESVAWISEQKNTLAMVFFLLSVLSYLRYESSGRRGTFVGSLLLFALSLLCKPMVILWPVVLLGYAWWKRGRIGASDVRRALPFFVLSALAGIITLLFSQANGSVGQPVGAATAAGRVAAALQALFFYLGKVLLPVDLCAIYSPESLAWPVAAYGVLAALVLFAVAAGARHGRAVARHAAFGLGFFALMLGPVLGLLDTSFLFYAPVCDRWAYAATAGILALLAAGGADLFRDRPGILKGIGVFAAVVLVGGLSFLSFDRSRVYHDSETLFVDTLEKNPKAWAAYASLGNLAFDRHRLDEAETLYREALKYKPDYWEAYNGLGIVCAVRGRLDEAIALFTRTLQLKPDHHVARRNLQMALKDKKQRTAGSQPKRAE